MQVVAEGGITASHIAERLIINPETGQVWRKWEPASFNNYGSKLIPAGTKAWNGYIIINYPISNRKYKKIRAHHLVWMWAYGEWPDREIDHINGDRSDNRIGNLRKATVAQNRTNKVRQSNNRSGFKWVSKFGSRYRAEIQQNRRRVYSSFHDTPEAAYAAACIAAKEIFGEWYNCGEKI